MGKNNSTTFTGVYSGTVITKFAGVNNVFVHCKMGSLSGDNYFNSKNYVGVYYEMLLLRDLILLDSDSNVTIFCNPKYVKYKI